MIAENGTGSFNSIERIRLTLQPTNLSRRTKHFLDLISSGFECPGQARTVRVRTLNADSPNVASIIDSIDEVRVPVLVSGKYASKNNAALSCKDGKSMRIGVRVNSRNHRRNG